MDVASKAYHYSRLALLRLNSRTVSLLKSASTVSVWTLASRITGLVRESLMAAMFGASAMTDAFNVAFRIPNLFRRLFAEGAFRHAAFGGGLAQRGLRRAGELGGRGLGQA